ERRPRQLRLRSLGRPEELRRLAWRSTMSVVALKPYTFPARDARENFPAPLLFIGWEDHLMISSPVCLPLPPDMPFGALATAALRQGIYIPHACCHGLCGTCKVQVCDGEVDHGHANPFALMEFERDEGKTLACCATLQCDTTIEADIDEEPDAQVIPVRDFAG